MNILEEHQVMCTIKLWYQKIFMDNFRVGGVLMILTPKLDYVYIIVNIFVNTQSILKIIASKCNVLMVYVSGKICHTHIPYSITNICLTF